MHCLIITGGMVEENFALPYMENHSFDEIIAVDSGIDFMYRVNKIPTLLVGDFDSVNPMALEYFKANVQMEVCQLIPEKDDTDTEHAIHEAISRGATWITILGATGTRIDHVLGNIALLGIGFKENVRIELLDSHNRITMAETSVTLQKVNQYGKYISLIPFSTMVEDVTLRGFKYSLTHGTLGGYNALGVSNEIVEEQATIEFSKGNLIIIESRD